MEQSLPNSTNFLMCNGTAGGGGGKAEDKKKQLDDARCFVDNPHLAYNNPLFYYCRYLKDKKTDALRGK